MAIFQPAARSAILAGLQQGVPSGWRDIRAAPIASIDITYVIQSYSLACRLLRRFLTDIVPRFSACPKPVSDSLNSVFRWRRRPIARFAAATVAAESPFDALVASVEAASPSTATVGNLAAVAAMQVAAASPLCSTRARAESTPAADDKPAAPNSRRCAARGADALSPLRRPLPRWPILSPPCPTQTEDETQPDWDQPTSRLQPICPRRTMILRPERCRRLSRLSYRPLPLFKASPLRQRKPLSAQHPLPNPPMARHKGQSRDSHSNGHK